MPPHALADERRTFRAARVAQLNGVNKARPGARLDQLFFRDRRDFCDGAAALALVEITTVVTVEILCPGGERKSNSETDSHEMRER